jgi:hypothetical protein
MTEYVLSEQYSGPYLDISLAQGLSQHDHDLALLSQEQHVLGAPRDHVEDGGDGQAGAVDDLRLQCRLPDHVQVQLPVPVQFIPLRASSHQHQPNAGR